LGRKGRRLLSPEIQPSVLGVVYEALLKNQRIRATYHAVHNFEKVYDINPLGLVFRHNVIYLVATLFEYIDIKQLALHRFKSAELIDRIVNVPEGFALDDYIAEGRFNYPVNNNLEDIKVSPFIKQMLQETPLGYKQKITEIDEQHYLIEVIIDNTKQLHRWLRSLGSLVEVLEPADLRAEFATEISRLSKMYQ
jgi:predicted DNA-binding transcriptional regulator YafY